MCSGNPRPRRSAGGFTYIGLLILIAVIGILLAFAGQVSSTVAQREREKELLFIGHAYRDAIVGFLRANHRYPDELKDLIDSADAGPEPAHFLRHLYPDPMTGAMDWILIKDPGGGGIRGVASSSARAPIKRAGFDDADVDFDHALSYSDWKFEYQGRPRRPMNPQGVHGAGVTP